MMRFIHSAMILGPLAAGVHADADALQPERTYFSAGQPILVDVAPPIEALDRAEDGDVPAPLALHLLDPEGRALGDAIEVRAGRLDLIDVFPELRDMRRTLYVQAIHQGEPQGSALVIQPLLEPMRAETAPATRPDGRPYQRVVAWSVEDPEPAVGRERRFFSGYRVHADRDVILHTSKGEIRIALRPEEAPNTVWNFLELSRGGFYRDVIFHRVVPLDRDGYPFVIQAGDPTGTGRGGPGYSIDLEPSDIAHDFGVISMARTDDPNSAGSQFFICLSREGTGRLDGQYTAFGHAVSGVEAILAIADVELADPETGRPAQPPLIHRAELVPAPPRIPGVGRPDARVERPAPPPPDPHPGRVPR